MTNDYNQNNGESKSLETAKLKIISGIMQLQKYEHATAILGIVNEFVRLQKSSNKNE